MSETRKFARLFLAPGMAHCGGGPGPNSFYGAGFPNQKEDADHDILAALDKWVTNETAAPEKIIATKFKDDNLPKDGIPPKGEIHVTRLLCAYPKRARLKDPAKIGDVTVTNAADNFECTEGVPPPQDQVPASEYQK